MTTINVHVKGLLVNNRANLKFFSHLHKGAATIIKGHTSKRKVVVVR